MSALISYVIRCDRCGHVATTDATRAAIARARVRAEGWTRPRRHPDRNRIRIDACPTCSTGEEEQL